MINDGVPVRFTRCPYKYNAVHIRLQVIRRRYLKARRQTNAGPPRYSNNYETSILIANEIALNIANKHDV